MSNSFSSRSNSGLIDASHTLVSGVGEKPADFGLSAEEISNLNSTRTALSAAMLAQSNARAMLDHAIAAKDAARAALLTALSQAAASVYSDAAVSDVQIRPLGLAPRRSGGARPQALVEPDNLVARGFGNSTVKLTWSRGATNIQGTTFQIESSTNGFDFEMVDTATRTSILLPNHVPGVACWFRVRAKRSGLLSPYSELASVYAPSEAAAKEKREAADLKLMKGGKAA